MDRHLDFTVDQSKWSGLGDFVKKLHNNYHQHYIYIYIYKFHMLHTGERYDSVYMYIFFEKLAPVNFYLGGALV